MRNLSHRAGAFAVSVVAIAAGTPAAAQVREFNIPAQPVASGIAMLARQADQQILIAARDARGKSTREVNGSFTVDQALERLLAGSGLQARRSELGTWSVVPREAMGSDVQSPPFSLKADAEAAPGNLDDIVVTARKVAEPLNKTPVAVTALTQEQLRRHEVRNPQDLNLVAPSLLVSGQFIGGRDAAAYTVRGLGVGGAIYFAGAPGGGGQQQFYDLANVQVIAGPQGTLFGRTSTGGAIQFEPNRPTFKFDGFLQAGVGNYDYSRLEGMINMPIIDDVLAVRAAGYILRRTGYTRSLDTGQDLDNQHRESFRIGVQFNPAGDLINSYSVFQYNNIDENGAGSLARDVNPAFTTPGSFGLYDPVQYGLFGSLFFGSVCTAEAARSGVSGNAAFINGCVAQRGGVMGNIGNALTSEAARIASGADGGIRSTRTTERQGFLSRAYSLVNNTSLNLGDHGFVRNLSLKNIFSYQWGNRRPGYFEDTDGTNIAVFDFVTVAPTGPQGGTCITSGANIGQCSYPVQPRAYAPEPPHQISEELNVSTKLFNRLNLLAGYFYLRSKSSDFIGYSSVNFAGVFNVARAPSINPLALGGTGIEQGLFVNGTLDLSPVIPNVRLTGGFRHTTTRNDSVSQPVAVTYDALGNPTVTSSAALAVSSNRDSGNNYNFSVDWQPTDKILIYTRSGTGFQPGGNNPGCSVAPAPTFCPNQYKKQVATDYEVGSKFSWSVGDIKLNTIAAIYRTDFNDIQVQRNVQRADSSTFVLHYNAAKARVNGAELTQNLQYKGLGIRLAYSYTESKYRKYFDAAPGFPCSEPINNSAGDCIDLSGERLVASVKNRLSGSVDWKLRLGDRVGTITPSIQATYSSSANYGRTLEQDPLSTAPGYTLVHSRIDWSGALGAPVDVGIFVRNVFDKKYVTYIAPLYSLLGYNTVQYGEPRTFGFELRYRFGAGGK